jgi:2,3-diketo-5-methylthiopentyl-1-phosphate enolase
MKEIILKENEIDKEKYFITEYFLESQTKLEDAALAIAIGQSWGNCEMRAGKWESPELIEKYCAKIIDENQLDKKQGYVRIAYPICNLDWIEDGIPQLLAVVQGGNLDIKNIQKCHVIDIEFSDLVKSYFKGPKFGLKKLRERTNCHNKPLLMAICKPKLMDSPNVLLDMIRQLVEGGVNLIKIDEINSSPPSCRFEDRIGPIIDYLKDKPVVYFDCITSEYPYLISRAKKASDNGLSGIHVNHWSGWGVYRTLRNLDLNSFIFCQRSGDKCMTDRNHRFHIKWSLLCKLLAMSGIDVAHGGMIFGYSDDCPIETKKALKVLNSFGAVGTLSCGFTPDLVEKVTNEVGTDYIIGAGGSIHSDVGGTTSGSLKFRKTIDSLYP